MRQDARDSALRDLVTQLGALGCLIEGYGDKLILVFHVVLRRLRKWRMRSM
jgi:hypothetical protein